ncbi:phospholipase B-like 1 [Anneissia japonica]|uniref:phospholipase B-like 1 n=1 Tax=Anneissia japonica TaxID=1529436 RepID=UPI0014256359|nr:phospholipase B-like 1 [Anneissia japonica]
MDGSHVILLIIDSMIIDGQCRPTSTLTRMKMKELGLFAYVFVVLLLVIHCKGDSLNKGTVYLYNQTFTFKRGVIDENGIAYGIYNDTLNTTGWCRLHVRGGFSSQKYSDQDIMYAAGFLEGALTSKHIRQHSINMNSWAFSGKPDKFKDLLKDFFKKQDTWMRMQTESNKNDPFWQGIGLLIAQFDGLVAGYNSNPYQNKLDIFDFQILNGNGDLIDLGHVLMPERVPDWRKMSTQEFNQFVATSGHCSALVKVLPGFEDVFMGHSSWFTYAATLRIYKHYDWQLQQKVASQRISFSSYPGYLESLDDFYILGSKMVMLQTTNNIFNKELYKHVKAESLLAWQRVRLANLLANNGSEWANIIRRYNSGTYNNQYMVIDRKKISKTSIDDGALWVVEQIPTLVESGDETAVLRAGYWPSYNVPFYEKIYNLSGYPEVVRERGPSYSYQLAPRAMIFRRDQSTVVDIESFKTILRYNNYKNDEYSDGNPCNSICCRGDLMLNTSTNGCYDTKVTNMEMADRFVAYAISGPTKSHGLPPFKWTTNFNVSHVGLPEVYNFEFIEMETIFD